MQKLIFVVFFLFFTSETIRAQNVESMMVEAKKMVEVQKEDEALMILMKVVEKVPNHYEALWNAAFLMCRVGNRQTEPGVKANYFRNAKEYSQRAIQANPTDAEGYFVMALAMGRIALIAGSKEKVAASADIKTNATKAVELNPNHAGAWHILSLWNLNVANLNFVERGFANLLFGGLPEGASNENALSCIKKAIALKPQYLLYHYDLARIHQTMGSGTLAKTACDDCLKFPNVSPDDPGIKEKCKVLKAEL